MDLIILVFIFIGVAFAFLTYSLYLKESTKLIRQSIGMPPGEIKYVDGVRVVRPKVLYSSKYKLKGKPDMIILQNNQFIPIEHKPTSKKVYSTHIMQLMAYCLLVEENYEITPSYGILVLKEGKKKRIDFTEKRREELINILDKMREMLNRSEIPFYSVRQKRCRSCGYEKICKRLGKHPSNTEILNL